MNFGSHTFRRRRVLTVDGDYTQLQIVVTIKRPSLDVSIQLEFLPTEEPTELATHTDIREAAIEYIDAFKNTEEADAVAAALERFSSAFA